MTDKFKGITVTPILKYSFSETLDGQPKHIFQPEGPTENSGGYAVLKNREDDFPVVAVTGTELADAVTAAKSLAKHHGVPFHRPEWLQQAMPEVISVQVIPFIEDPESAGIQTQLTGPTAETSGWGVYLRQETGKAMWVADTGNEKEAMFVGKHYATSLGVDIEEQPWKEEGAK